MSNNYVVQPKLTVFIRQESVYTSSIIRIKLREIDILQAHPL